MSSSWPAPFHPAPVTAQCVVPGSKSITNRALALAAVANGTSTITGALASRDTQLMCTALRTLGAHVLIDGPHITVTPLAAYGGGHVDCGLAGTVMRFVPPIAALAEGTVIFDGDEQARVRPMTPILQGLSQAGVQIEGTGLPFSVHGSGSPRGGRVEIDASGSSQFVSGLLLAGSRMSDGLHLVHTGDTLPSAPHIQMTVQMLRDAGVTIEAGEREWRVHPGEVQARDWVVEPDLSNATPFLAAAAVTGGSVTIPHWPCETTQPGEAIRPILSDMGCTVVLEDGALTVTGPDPARLQGVTMDMADIGELTPTVAAIAALATTETRITGVAHLRGHETDRLKALATEINRLGGTCTELSDGLRITPTPLTSGLWHAYADHRMATAGAIIGLRTEGVAVDDIACTSKTLPGFESMWGEMLRG